MSQVSWVGKTLSDRYQIEDLLGQGGMSAVYKAQDPNLRRVVAVKLIHPHLSADPEFVRRFEEEATAVAQLRHPNIIQVFDYNQDEGAYYMVLEFVPGETLQERLKRLNAEGRRMSTEDAIKFTSEVCDAADYAHKRGMIHRDIKPANVMLNIHGQAILMDFGIAKIVGGEQHTATGAVIGTALYMAPEQIRGEKIDERVDVYAIGVTLFEMLNGNPPYEAESAMTLMMKHLNDPIPDLHSLQPDVPVELVAVVEKALAKDRTQRFANAAEMAAALNAILPGTAEQAPLSAAAVKTTEESSPQAPTAQEPAAETGAVIAAAGVAAAAAAAAPTGAGPTAGVTNTAGEAAVEAPTSAAGVTPATGATPAAAATGAVGAAPTAGAAAAEGSPPAAGVNTGAAAPPAPASPPTSQATQPPSRRNMTLIGGGIALAFVMLCLIVGVVFAYGQFSNGGEEDNIAAAVAMTQTAAAELALLSSPTPDEVEEIIEPTEAPEPTPTPTETEEALPTDIPTPVYSPTPMYSPTPTVPPGVHYVRINDISLDRDGNYLVEYELFEISDQLVLDGYHLTFFFDDVPPDQVGSPYETLYYMYAGPSPFNKFTVALRSEVAQHICALITKPNHIVEPESGNCFPLPDAVEGAAGTNVLLVGSQDLGASPTPTYIPTPTKEKKDKDPGY